MHLHQQHTSTKQHTNYIFKPHCRGRCAITASCHVHMFFFPPLYTAICMYIGLAAMQSQLTTHAQTHMANRAKQHTPGKLSELLLFSSQTYVRHSCPQGSHHTSPQESIFQSSTLPLGHTVPFSS